jgi:hypothetical protein
MTLREERTIGFDRFIRGDFRGDAEFRHRTADSVEINCIENLHPSFLWNGCHLGAN